MGVMRHCGVFFYAKSGTQTDSQTDGPRNLETESADAVYLGLLKEIGTLRGGGVP